MKVLFEWKRIVPQIKILYGKVSILTVKIFNVENPHDFFPKIYDM